MKTYAKLKSKDIADEIFKQYKITKIERNRIQNYIKLFLIKEKKELWPMLVAGLCVRFNLTVDRRKL